MKKIIAPVVLLAAYACNNSDSSKEKTEPAEKTAVAPLVFDQIVGTWQSEDGKSFERWTKNNSSYQTAGFTVKESDTVWNEQGSVYKENETWIFENKVHNQNEGKAIRFSSTILNSNTVQFSNPAHDFPTDINYTLNHPDTLNAFIVGPSEKGGKDTIPFNFIRIK